MAKPALDIQVDGHTGEWRVDGMPMILVPRHFLVNNHVACEKAIGVEAYAKHLHDAGYKSAWQWCEKESARHGLHGIDVFHHYMRRLSQRGWAQFKVESVDPDTGRARVSVRNSVFATGHHGPPRKTCYMFRGWFPGALEYVAAAVGSRLELTGTETQCAAEGHHEHCVFETGSSTNAARCPRSTKAT